jgi:integrase
MSDDQSAAVTPPPDVSIDPATIEAVRRLERQRPTEPWVPKHSSVFPVKSGKKTHRNGKEVPCWDVRWRVDGWDFQMRFTRPSGTSEMATKWAEGLAKGFVLGWAFDPVSRRFLDPDERGPFPGGALVQEPGEGPADDRPTVATTAVSYLRRRWRRWRPRSRQAAVRALKRACADLLRDGAPEAPGNLGAYLDWLLQPVRDEPASDLGALVAVPGVPAEFGAADDYLSEWSIPVADLKWQTLEAFLARYERNQRSPDRSVSDATTTRFIADVRQFVSDAAIRNDVIDPWPALQRMTRGTKAQPSRVEPVDADLVLSPEQVWALARACAEHGSWGDGVICFILVMGLCGLRPGEAIGLRIVDLELPDTGPGWLKAWRSALDVTERWRDPDEDPDWGSLKRRRIGDSRRPPIPEDVVGELKRHLATSCAGAKSTSLVFMHSGERFDMDAFVREVWDPAVAALFPADPDLDPDDPGQPKLSSLVRQDLRYAACSLWLNAGVAPKVCQRWSGHATLSVFLDIYQGIMPGSEEDGVAAVERFLAKRDRPSSSISAGPTRR